LDSEFVFDAQFFDPGSLSDDEPLAANAMPSDESPSILNKTYPLPTDTFGTRIKEIAGEPSSS